ncbi:hypothetical protein D3M95_09235 [Corynebacterium falsenii]|uniref:Uncharacterized protein n=1 Tax=Corynebacterium falsenii TaxID=108486 RepID=A0A418Q5G5_9CORY|nr:hypothetical protein D3M95_09235 [Corynebacterium falsenii]
MLGLVGAMSGVTEYLTPSPPVSIAFFVVMLLLQIWPLYLTQQSTYGHFRHPVNRMYSLFSVIGIVGTIVMFSFMVIRSSVVAVSIAGSLMFMGIVGAGVLAFFATPWRDHMFREDMVRRERSRESAGDRGLAREKIAAAQRTLAQKTQKTQNTLRAQKTLGAQKVQKAQPAQEAQKAQKTQEAQKTQQSQQSQGE